MRPVSPYAQATLCALRALAHPADAMPVAHLRATCGVLVILARNARIAAHNEGRTFPADWPFCHANVPAEPGPARRPPTAGLVA